MPSITAPELSPPPPRLVAAALLAPAMLLGLAPGAVGPLLATIQREFSTQASAALLVPMVLTLPAACIALLSGVAGLITDKVGRKIVLVVALTAYIVAGIAPLFLQGLWPILAARFLLGIAEAGIYTSATTLIGDTFEGEKRERMLAYQIVVSMVTAVAASIIAGSLASFGWRYAMTLHLVAVPLLLLTIIVVREPRRRTTAADRSAASGAGFPWRLTLNACAFMLMTSMFFSLIPTQLGYILAARGIMSPQTVGLMLAGIMVGAAAGAVIFRLLAGWGIGIHFLLGYGIAAVGIAGLTTARGLGQLFVLGFFAQAGIGLVVPAILATAMRRFEFEFRGRGTGIMLSSNALGQFVSAIFFVGLMTLTASLNGALMVFAVWAALVAIGSLLVVLRSRAPALAAQ